MFMPLSEQAFTSFSWLEPMLSMAMGLLGALLPDMSCSVRMCGECKGWGAEPPVGPIFAGGDGGTSPATAWTVYGQRKSTNINKCTTALSYVDCWTKQTNPIRTERKAIYKHI